MAQSSSELYLERQGQNFATAGHAAWGLIYRDLLQQASALRYLDGFRIMALVAVAVPFVWIMKKTAIQITPGAGGIVGVAATSTISLLASFSIRSEKARRMVWLNVDSQNL